MATLVLGTATANSLLNAIFNQTNYTAPTAIYVTLHSSDPGANGAGEITAGGNAYARQVATAAFGAANAKAVDSTADLTWTNMPSVTVSHVGIWTAETAGTFLGGGALTASKTVSAGDTFKIASGSFDVSLS